MEWTVVSALVVLVGLFLTIGKPILNACKEMVELRKDTTINARAIQHNSDDIKELLKVSQSHEIRIHDLEQDVGEIKSKEK